MIFKEAEQYGVQEFTEKERGARDKYTWTDSHRGERPISGVVVENSAKSTRNHPSLRE